MADPWLRRPLGVLARLRYYRPTMAEPLSLCDSRPYYHGVPWTPSNNETSDPPCSGLSMAEAAAFHACVFFVLNHLATPPIGMDKHARIVATYGPR